MSLADELLNDFEEGDEGDALESDNFMDVDTDSKANVKIEPNISDTDFFKAPLPVKPKTKLVNVRQVAKLWDSTRLKDIKTQIEKYTNQKRAENPLENNSEYKLIIDANNIFVDVENEIGIIHKYVKEIYSKRFPELESLVTNPFEYLNAVKELGNDLDKVKNSEVLATILTQATIMIVSLTASTTKGLPLLEEELDLIEDACQMAHDLNLLKIKIFEYVESKMNFVAPNLSIVLGASTAAKLMGAVGGIMNLCKIPSGNFAHIGKLSKNAGSSQFHSGIIAQCDLIQQMPPDLQSKAIKLVSYKATLASRVDALGTCKDGSEGKLLRESIEKKMDKLQEPPPVKNVKPLPAPIDAPGKKRGGKRVRKMKERLAVTDLRKAQNRMNFGEIEEDAYQDDLGYTRGQLGKGGAGKIRKITVDEKTRVRLSKTLQKEVHRQNTYGGASTVKRQIAGTASSVAFTPLQGLEIVNPQAADRSNMFSNQKYFSNVTGFKNVK